MINMSAEAASDSHAREAADLQDQLEEIAGEIITIISRARSSRVDRNALKGLVDAVEALDEDAASAVDNAMKGSGRKDYRTDAEMFEAIREILDQLSTADSDEAEYAERTRRDLIAANDRRSAAEAELTAARAMGVSNPCDGCHAAREAAIEGNGRQVPRGSVGDGALPRTALAPGGAGRGHRRCDGRAQQGAR